MQEVRVTNLSMNPLPEYETEGSAGMDIRANNIEPIEIMPNKWALIPTGIFLELPKGLEAQIRSRSGLALKKGVAILNGVGTIDSDYRGEVGVILKNHSDVPFVVNGGDRVAQMVIASVTQIKWVESGELTVTGRGTGGFGSTGLN